MKRTKQKGLMRLLAMAMVLSLAFPGTAFAAAPGESGDPEPVQAMEEQISTKTAAEEEEIAVEEEIPEEDDREEADTEEAAPAEEDTEETSEEVDLPADTLDESVPAVEDDAAEDDAAEEEAAKDDAAEVSEPADEEKAESVSEKDAAVENEDEPEADAAGAEEAEEVASPAVNDGEEEAGTAAVTVDLNGGSWTDEESYYAGLYKDGRTVNKGETIYLPYSSNVTRTGYQFLGWSRTIDGEVLDSNYYVVDEDTTFYAQWEKTYTVTYDLNGGQWAYSYMKDSQTAVVNTQIYLPGSYNTTKDGYKLLGWTTTKNGSGPLTGEYKVTKDITLYAKWGKTYTIKFNLNGGKWENDYYRKDGVTDVKGTKIYLPGSYYAARSGYLLLGWTTTKNGAKVLSNPYSISKDITLYAKWIKSYKVTFNAGAGYFGTSKTNTKKVIEVATGSDAGSMITDSSNRPRNGSKAFLGWYKDSKCTKPAKKSDVIKKNTTYYAKWQTKSYKITVTNIKGAGYYNRATNEYVSSGDSTATSYSFYIVPGDSIGSVYAYKSGKAATFYFDKACKQKPYYYNYVPTGNTTVYAKWTNEVTVTWKGNGGKDEWGDTTGTITCEKGKMLDYYPDDITRAGYYLVGWVDLANTSKLLPASHVFSKDTTIRARWAKGIKIKFNLGGGKTDSSTLKNLVSSGTTVKAKAKIGNYVDYIPQPVRSGYTFAGWKSSVTKKVISNIYNDKPAKATTYTATWKKNSVKVTLIAGDGSIYDSANDKYVTKLVVQIPKNTKLGDSTLGYSSYDEWSKNKSLTGWSLTKTGKALAQSYKFTKNVTLYPVWGKTTYLQVAMVTNGGAIDKYACNEPEVYSIKKGTTIALPTGSRIEREGYTFVGWYTDYKCTKKIAAPAKYKPTKSVYVYAKWKKK